MFVGGFIGSPSMNLLYGKLIDNHFVMGDVKVLVPDGKLEILRNLGYTGKDVVLGIRPEDIHDEPLFLDFSSETKIKADIEVAELMRSEIVLYSRVNDQDFVARVDARFNVEAGTTIDMTFNMNKAHFFDSESEVRIK